MILASSVDWTTVIVSLITVVPAIIAAVYAGRVHHKIKTPSGTSIGTQVEDTLHTAIVNNHHLVGAAQGAQKVAAELAVERAARPAEELGSPDDTAKQEP